MTFTREWMYKIGTGEFYDGIEEFMKQADSFARSKGFVDGTVQCPCNSCKNLSWKGIEDAKYDLYRYGFVPNYYVWDKHGEQPSQRINREMPNRAKAVNLARNMVIDAAGSQFEDLIFEAPTPPEPPNPAAKRFFDLLSKADAPLYKGCEGHSTLSATSRMLNIKSDFNMSQTCYDRVMQAIKEFIPRSTMCSNYYESKKMVSQLGLGYLKIDCCPNGCMLYYGKKNEGLDKCYRCDHARYKPKEQGSLNGKDISYKGLEEFDQIHAPFAAEPRNVRLGLCTDGFTPFGMSSTSYSCWPVIVTPYNLPPWLCMKIPYMFLTLIIPGPHSPKKNIDVFLQPLIDELYVLWKDGVDTYDAFRERNFNLKAALMWTINDFPAYGMLSGWSTHGGFLPSHDCHVFMERLLPIAFREMLPEPIWKAMTEILPPGFFDHMEHLLVHLSYEARVGGPEQYRWMYPFERYLYHLKKKVKNKARVESSICEAYIMEEISNFCTHYFESHVETNSRRVGRNDDGGNLNPNRFSLSIFNHRGRPSGTCKRRYLDDDEVDQEVSQFWVPVICLLDAVQEYGSNDAPTLPDSSQLTELQTPILFNALGTYLILSNPPDLKTFAASTRSSFKPLRNRESRDAAMMENEDVDQQLGEEDRRIVLTIQGGSFNPSNNVTSTITSIWKSRFTGAWDNWTIVPAEDKEIWFNSFKSIPKTSPQTSLTPSVQTLQGRMYVGSKKGKFYGLPSGFDRYIFEHIVDSIGQTSQNHEMERMKATQEAHTEKLDQVVRSQSSLEDDLKVIQGVTQKVLNLLQCRQTAV
ncbi:hypothetical protein Tco_1036497 [Tanacetum coccineum]